MPSTHTLVIYLFSGTFVRADGTVEGKEGSLVYPPQIDNNYGIEKDVGIEGSS